MSNNVCNKVVQWQWKMLMSENWSTKVVQQLRNRILIYSHTATLLLNMLRIMLLIVTRSFMVFHYYINYGLHWKDLRFLKWFWMFEAPELFEALNICDSFDFLNYYILELFWNLWLFEVFNVLMYMRVIYRQRCKIYRQRCRYPVWQNLFTKPTSLYDEISP